jgi:hypothetical protein
VGVLAGEALFNWVMKTCLVQGVPVKVNDVRVIDRVRTLLSGKAAGTERSVSTAEPAGSPSEAPDRVDPIGVERVGTLGGGLDDGVKQKGVDDGLLSAEAEGWPLKG